MQPEVTVEFGTVGNLLSDDDIRSGFDCTPDNVDKNYLTKYQEINEYLLHAIDEQKNAFAVTNLMFIDKQIAGFYVLQMGVTKVSKRYKRNTPRFHGTKDGNIGYPSVDVPYFAIDSNFQGQGLGRVLLKHLMLNVYWQVLPVIGGCFITLDALNPAIDFYSKFGFKEYSQDGLNKKTKAMACLSFDIETVLSLKDGIPEAKVADEIKSLSDTLPMFALKK